MKITISPCVPILKGGPLETTGRYIYMRVSPLAITRGFAYIISHPIDRPCLSVVCMPAELQVDADSFRFFQVKRLMIQ